MKKVLGLLTALLIAWSPASANEMGTCGYLHDYWTDCVWLALKEAYGLKD